MRNTDGSVAVLVDLVYRLRDRETGCPWDNKQTEESLAPYVIEEAHEVVQAIEEGGEEELSVELGDLLFLIVLFSCIAQEQGKFDFYAVVERLSRKLVNRHLSVFGPKGEGRTSSSGHKGEWERAKLVDRQRLSEGLPKSLPALMLAEKIQRRAAAVGFDWSDYRGPESKVVEEWSELQTAVDNKDSASMKEEFGDLLFSLVNLARHLEVDCEQALRAANSKFQDRFAFIEDQLSQEGKQLQDVTLETLDKLWEQAKLDCAGMPNPGEETPDQTS